MLKRSITGLLLGIVMIGGLISSPWSAVLLFAIILAGSAHEWNYHFIPPVPFYRRWIFAAFTLAGLCILLYMTWDASSEHFQRVKLTMLSPSLVALTAILTGAIAFHPQWSFATRWYCGIFYLIFPLLIAQAYLVADFEQARWHLLGLVVINWSNDVFAYFTGRLAGRHPLAPGISPKKTLEGAAGGLVAALLASYLINAHLWDHYLPFASIAMLGTLVWLAGTAGDLYESRMKRLAGIKDSGNILPGHGGFLDRFDSFFVVIIGGIFVLSW